jgi:methionyl-tRNA synthetase
VIRFYGALLAPQNHDTELDWAEFEKLRSEVLANQYGNLVQRTLVLVRDRHSGKVPEPPSGWSSEGSASGVGERLRVAHAKITEEYEKVHLKEALELALEEVREANRRFHEARPWQASEEDRRRTLYETLWRLKSLATWLAPVLPFSSADVFRMLGYDGPPGPGEWDVALSPVPAGQSLGEVRPLFPRAEAENVVGAPAPVLPPTAEWPPLAACAGVIRGAAPHPAADKLYVLEVDVGESSHRTVVSASPVQLAVHV